MKPALRRVQGWGRGGALLARSPASGWSVDLGPRADADPLAREIRRRIVAHLEHGEALGSFRRMWGTVVIVAVGEEAAGGHTTLTLRFDWGRLMIHEGRVGRPDVTLWGSPASILSLGQGWRGGSMEAQPWSAAASLRARFRGRTSPHVARPRIYGALRHPRFLWRLGRLLAPT